MCLATMGYVYTVCPVHVTIFNIGSKFWLVSKLHALTLVTCPYALLAEISNCESFLLNKANLIQAWWIVTHLE